jgi:uncharacterized protein (DUF1697 family)
MALVVLLRGVNVGGHKTFRPKIVADQLKRFDVVNIGAAGSFVVRKPVTETKLRAEMARALPFDAEIMVCRGEDVVSLVEDDPFAGAASGSDIVRFVSVLARHPTAAVKPFGLPADDDWLLKVAECRGRFVLGMYRRQMKAVGFLGRLDTIFAMPVTTRNWNTMVALARVVKDAGWSTRSRP